MEIDKNKPPVQLKIGTAGLLDEKTFSKYFLLIVFILSLIAFLSVIRIFILDIVLAAVVATLFLPLYKCILKLFRGSAGLSAFVSCLIILLGILLPVLLISDIVLVQGIDLYHTAEPQVRELIQKGVPQSILDRVEGTWLGSVFESLAVDWHTVSQNALEMLGATGAKLINKTSRATLRLVINLFVILFSVFYFLRDGEHILQRVRAVIPLSEEYKDRIVSRFSAISRATVRGVLLIALIQSFLGTMTLWIFGVDAWLLWGVVMLVFSVIPFVGTGGILIPTGIISIISGNVWQGVAIICISVFVVSTIDNFLRPRLVGSHAGMHDLIVFFSTLGGIAVFGPSGFIMGPLIAAIFLTVLDIFSIEFQEHIEYSNK
jgi:predicted PurR-regulated permease PerM